ncbi:hypothetical protein AVEN_87195-1 [Araneus ventricosus]|uniref:Uncharacterized protein n=1 Tax=Araneus ventricosus TaxID=182803 RepID=A0A4Y2TDM8_ARAVE|nr:hypothetical protein AVEN_87195-1 [Araneus ventricosus]
MRTESPAALPATGQQGKAATGSECSQPRLTLVPSQEPIRSGSLRDSDHPKASGDPFRSLEQTSQVAGIPSIDTGDNVPPV